MYCGRNKTALASQQQISQAMMRLIQEKPFSQITISELCKEAGTSRQTFYSLFTSRENVMVYTLHSRFCSSQEISSVIPQASCRQESLHLLCRGCSQYLYQNRHLLSMLVENKIDYLLYDSVFDLMNRSDCLLGGLDPCQRRYASSFYAGGVSCVARQYAREGCDASPEKLEALLLQLFTGSFFSD